MSAAPRLAAILFSVWAGEAVAGLVVEPPAGVNEPRFYMDLRAMLTELSTSQDPHIRRLYELARSAPATIRIRPMTDDRSTWNNDGSKTRAHTEPDDKRRKDEGRAKPSDATVFLPPGAVQPGVSFWNGGVLPHELTHAIDLAYGRYNRETTVRERRATFMQNVWRNHIGYKLRTNYHGRFATLDYQEASRLGKVDEYAEYIFTRADFPKPPAGKAAKGEKGEKDDDN